MISRNRTRSRAIQILLLISCISSAQSGITFMANSFTYEGFVPITDAVSGSCKDDAGRDSNVFLTDSSDPCSAIFPTSSDLKLQLDEQQQFSIPTPELRNYNFWCSDPDGNENCIAILIYNLTMRQTDQGLMCSLEFANDGETGGYRYPTKVFWKKNEFDVEGFPQDLTADSFTSSGSTLGHEALLDGEELSAGSYECLYEFKDQLMQPAAPLVIPSDSLPEIFSITVKEVGNDEDVRQFMDGQNVTLNCTVVQDYPMPTITWYHNQQELSPQALSFNISRDADFVSSSFTLTNIDDSVHRGEYMCKASNAMGSTDDTITLHVRDKLAPLWPFIGIVLQVIVLAICIAIGEKFRKKKLAEKQRRKQFGDGQAAGPSAQRT